MSCGASLVGLRVLPVCSQVSIPELYSSEWSGDEGLNYQTRKTKLGDLLTKLHLQEKNSRTRRVIFSDEICISIQVEECWLFKSGVMVSNWVHAKDFGLIVTSCYQKSWEEVKKPGKILGILTPRGQKEA